MSKKNLLLFLGAGFSKDAGCPLQNNFFEHVEQKFPGTLSLESYMGITAARNRARAIREYYLDRQKYKRNKSIEYLEKQIQLYSQMYYFLEGGRVIGTMAKNKFDDLNEEYKEFNSELRKNAHYFERYILRNWYTLLRARHECSMDCPSTQARRIDTPRTHIKKAH